MRKFFLNLALLLSALIVGSGNVWGDNVNVISEDFSSNSTTAMLTNAGWTLTGKNSMNSTKLTSTALQIASGKGEGSAKTPSFSSLVGNSATLTFRHISSGSAARTLTITGTNCKVDGKTSTTVSVGTTAGSSTIEITEASTSSSVTFSAATNEGTIIDDIVVYYTPASTSPLDHITLSGTYPTTFTVGDAFNHEGMTVTAVYENDEENNVTNKATFTGYNMSETGAQTVTVSYTESEVTKTATYDITVKANPNLTFSPTSVDVAIGGETTVVFTKSTDADASFEVADETIATYDPLTGKIEGKKEGTTTLTATTSATSVYSAGEAICTITVYDPNWLDYTKKGYSNATDVTTESYASGSVTLALGSNSNGNNPKWYDSGSAVRLYAGNTITITAKAGFLLTSVEFSVTSGSMSEDSFSSKVKKVGSTNEFTLETPANEIVYTTGSNFRIDKVKLIIADVINLNSACTDGELYYATYSNSSAFVVPSDLTVSEIGIVDGKLYVEDYNTGDIVPANTGVMISSEKSGVHYLTLAAGGTSVLDTDNMLKPSSEAMTGDNLFYRLTMHNGTQIGFYWGAENGAAFDLAANKAYLAVPNGSSAPMRFWFTDEENNATNIENIESGEETVKFIENEQMLIKKNGIVYDVMGRVVR